MSYAPLSLLANIRDGGVVILPVPTHLTAARFQANVKAIQSKSRGRVSITTEQVFFFSKKPPFIVREAIQCTIARKETKC